jgi:hypothetical protein
MSTAETRPGTGATIAAPMADTERQTAAGKVLWHFTRYRGRSVIASGPKSSSLSVGRMPIARADLRGLWRRRPPGQPAGSVCRRAR